jgi:predicted O-methyltransferase YrrM
LLLSLVERQAQRLRGEALNILEIGSWVGASALTLAEGLVTFNAGRGQVFCCDYWEKTDEVQYQDGWIHVHNSPPQNNFPIFMYNIRVSGYHHLITPMMGDSRVVAALRDGYFDLVYVDGFHGYSVARSDIENGKRLLRDGGILAGDDLDLERGQCDEAALVAQAEQDHGHDPKSGQPFHPGVTLAVAEALGPAKPFCSVWAYEKAGAAFSPVDLTTLNRHIPSFFPEWAQAQTRRNLQIANAAPATQRP